MKHNRSPLDITGQRFGTLVATRLDEQRSPHGHRQWWCSCDCGSETLILQGSLTSGNTSRCNDHPKNEYEIYSNVVKMDVSTDSHKHQFTIFDIDDLDRVINFKNQTGRMRWIYTDSSVQPDALHGKYVMGTDRKTRLHRFILGDIDPQLIVDHINGNTMDNRKENLRVTTRRENNKNMRMRITNTSGHTGVRVNARSGLYEAKIQLQGKTFFLGSFNTLSDANIAYRSAAKVLGFSERHGTKC